MRIVLFAEAVGRDKYNCFGLECEIFKHDSDETIILLIFGAAKHQLQ